MREPLLSLAPSDLRALAAAIASGRLTPPFSTSSVERYVNAATAQSITQSLQALIASGTSIQGLARVLELLEGTIAGRPSPEDLVELVTTGPDCGMSTRDTSVVVQDLFHNATDSVVVVGYAVRQGQQVFQALARRMTDLPTLQVRMCLDIQRAPGDSSATSEIVARFVNHFRRIDWPIGTRLPEIFYDPRSLTVEPDERASLHAKCVVVDRHTMFVSSANFTEVGQERNIEVGLMLQSPLVAERLLRFVGSLIEGGQLKQAF